MNRSRKEISVFMPFYNEEDVAEETVEDAVDILESLDYEFELILVDDGSQDDTKEILREFAEENDRINAEIHEENRGYGEALKTGFSSADKDLIFYTDGDGQFDITEIKKLLDEIDDADMVVGYRSNRKDSFSREITSDVFNQLARLILPIKEKDIDCAFKLVKRETVEEIKLKTERTVDAELLAKARNNGREIKEVPVEHLPREAGESEAEGLVGVRLTLILKSVEELVSIRRSLN